MITEDPQAKTQSACYTVDMKMNQESLYHMVSVEKHLNPSAPLWVWLTFTALLWTCRAGCVISILLRISGIFHSLTPAIIFLILAYLVRTIGPGFIRSGLFNSDRSNRMQLDTAWKRFLVKNGEPLTVTYEFYRNYFRTSGGRAVHAYSQISHICETQRCLVLYTMDHGGYLLDKRQMGAVCINGLRTFLSERSGKSVKWIQVRDYIPVKSN